MELTGDHKIFCWWDTRLAASYASSFRQIWPKCSANIAVFKFRKGSNWHVPSMYNMPAQCPVSSWCTLSVCRVATANFEADGEIPDALDSRRKVPSGRRMLHSSPIQLRSEIGIELWQGRNQDEQRVSAIGAAKSSHEMSFLR